MELQQNIEKKVAELIHRLPPMPGNIDRLLLAAGDPHTDDLSLLGLVEQDPSLCANLLHLANTFCSRPEGHDETLEEAVATVGIKPLVQLIGVWYAKDTITKVFAPLERLDDYFRHSQEISSGCRILSEVMKIPDHDREVSSVAGLIHDMGRLAIMLAANRTTTPLMGTQWSQMESIVEQEKQLLGMDHCEIGMGICKKWNFSASLQQGVLRHHSPLINDDFNLLGAIIFIAHFVTCSDFTGQMLSSMLPAELLQRLKLNETDFEKARVEYLQRRSNGTTALIPK
jgi:HD-like signal output (HDOD) protein